MALAEKDGKSLAFAGGSDYELIFPEFQPAFDGLYGAAKVMELLAAEKGARERTRRSTARVAHGKPRGRPARGIAKAW